MKLREHLELCTAAYPDRSMAGHVRMAALEQAQEELAMMLAATRAKKLTPATFVNNALRVGYRLEAAGALDPTFKRRARRLSALIRYAFPDDLTANLVRTAVAVALSRVRRELRREERDRQVSQAPAMASA